MTKKIKINIDNTLTGLAGFPYGKEIFDNQVKNKLEENDYKYGFEIIFPEQIKRVASSFSQGFFSYLIDKIGYYNVIKVVKIKTSSSSLSKSIFSVLE
ncbi:hypothetical protein DY138_00495 [Apilactobacillus timberlakei]|uniref:hypothetical protein n=1 Tax=Apilactobacillus timberlakei TaxID=2008380 RepID=UPI00112B960D|nr:hypothetical protein [Apilactobacillus timberlakei]TPR19948.1 hypothetical protein DY138_00495 [Apilactobacillus timberlakei]TPR21666.1 hypothetical protein DY061_00410 [Apilactobacillus timberlakei]TPR22912.1 hypothetical protein DY083_02230 [Apilactobacillus timberlakei]